VVNGLPWIVVFAPNPLDNGLCIPLMAGVPNGADAFIYFAPSLERQSQTDVDFTVAHAFFAGSPTIVSRVAEFSLGNSQM
jgi:hypothetical protein